MLPYWLVVVLCTLLYLFAGFCVAVVLDTWAERLYKRPVDAGLWVVGWLFWPLILVMLVGFACYTAGELARKRINAGFLAARESARRLGSDD